MVRPITFPHTGPGEWTNRETGVMIRYNPDAGYQVWGRGLPTDGPVSGGTPSHRRSVGLGSEPHTYLHDALAGAKRYVADAARPAIEAAHAEALREDWARRTVAAKDADRAEWNRQLDAWRARHRAAGRAIRDAVEADHAEALHL